MKLSFCPAWSALQLTRESRLWVGRAWDSVLLQLPVLLCLWVSDRLSPASLQVDQCLCEGPGGFPFFILPRPGACDSVAGSRIVTKSCKVRRCALTGEQITRLVQPPAPLLSTEVASDQRAGLRKRPARSPEVPGCGALRADCWMGKGESQRQTTGPGCWAGGCRCREMLGGLGCHTRRRLG